MYRGWRVLLVRQYLEGDRRSYYSAKPTRELMRKFMKPPYWKVPEFGSMDEAKAWVDDTAPYKLQ